MREIVLILGQTGSGKTTQAAREIDKLSRVFIADADFQEYRAVNFDSLPDCLKYLDVRRAGPFRVAYTPYPDEYDLIFEIGLALQNCSLLLEEADRFGWDLPHYQEVLVRGRHYGVSLICVGLSAVMIPLAVRRQATKIISFAQMHPDDLDALAEVVGPQIYKLSTDPETGRALLPDFSKLIWTPREGTRIVSPEKPLGPK